MAGKVTAVDPGSQTIKVVGLKDTKRGLVLTRFVVMRTARHVDCACSSSGVLGHVIPNSLCGDPVVA